MCFGFWFFFFNKKLIVQQHNNIHCILVVAVYGPFLHVILYGLPHTCRKPRMSLYAL